MSDSIMEELIFRIKPIRTLLLDVDGVLTDGTIIIDSEGKESKHFNVKDGHLLSLFIKQGYEVFIISGRFSRAVDLRATELGITEVHQGVRDKVAVFEEIMERKGLSAEQVAFIGDDLVDVPLLKRVGFAVAVADAVDIVKTCVHYVTKQGGGRGAVREVCELILKGQGKWELIEKKYELSDFSR